MIKRRSSAHSLPGQGFGFLDASTYDSDATSSDIDTALASHLVQAREMASKLAARMNRTDGEDHPTADTDSFVKETYALANCIYIGHLNTDTDSIASAVGAAYLFGGIPARSERQVNGEIRFACEYAQAQLPEYFDDIPGATDPLNQTNGICLVDHNEPGQMIESVQKVAFPRAGQVVSEYKCQMQSRIKGVFDHHALSSEFSTPQPIFIDCRPWGSACSIIAHSFVRMGQMLPVHVAKLLLCGILSDTINLTSPTTTRADKLFATLLAFWAEEKHPNILAQNMFKAKTAYLTNLSAYHVVRADQKTYKMGEVSVGWATIEVNDPFPILAKAHELLFELRVLKKEKQLDLVFLSVVDIQQKRSVLLLCGSNELSLARVAFNGRVTSALEYARDSKSEEHNCGSHVYQPQDHLATIANDIHLDPSETLMDIGSRVSRKKEFIIPVKSTISSGAW
eukprot:CAMPEP_0203752024 /NCGR_PEP_ID=MMETSP0098-20131031/6004_1 /ASSEMBLY_ACC=CAM_ASM_000208 /TAXON_ID=96639 /ORGANISM=" , Strain NY0313808BC1" /LENGTH=452 /DNA_ID=CAMNT_0050642005 /DNA_START=134 /DNA_END=1489 /DNA_ORIENTATION=+